MTCTQLILSIILSLNPSKSPEWGEQFAQPICIESQKRNINPLIVVAVIHHETGWRNRKIYHNKNGTYDYGLMQFNCPKKMSNSSFRRWWCKRSNRKLLLSIRGNIAAGVKELSTWKDICYRKHKTKGILNKGLDCLDCFKPNESKVPKEAQYISKFILPKYQIKRVIKDHWWVRHYNWNSRYYGLRILYIYTVLQNQMKDNYIILQKRLYPKLNLRYCLQTKDLCLGKFKHGNKNRTRKKTTRNFRSLRKRN